MATATEARRMIDAIDKRIDAVQAELIRRRPPFDELSCFAWQRAWDSYPGLQGIERSLYARRGHWQALRDAAETKEHQAAERKRRAAERKAHKARQAIPFRQCECCGSYYQPLAA